MTGEEAIGMAATDAKKRRYLLEIPRIEALIERGATTSGRALTKDEIKELRFMLKHRKQVVGTYGQEPT